MAPLLSLGLLLEWFRAVYVWMQLFYYGLPLVVVMLEMEMYL